MPNKFYPNLFSPLKVGGLILKNRIQTGPMSMTELGSTEGLSLENIAFYESLAKGGAAVVTIGESIIPTENGKTHHQQIMLGRKEVLPSLVQVADAIHAHGALADIEISHGGAMADPSYNNGKRAMGPVSFVDEWGDTIVEMDEVMMNQVADGFADAVETVRKCDFDMAMIHVGHGWLLSQFLSPLYNTRTDQYGGSRENRNRFPLMVLERVRNRVGKDFVLDMRVSGSEFLDGGAEIEDCVAFCIEAQKYVDLINVSAGAPWTTRMVPSIFDERGCNAVFAEAVKKAVKIPVTTVGGFVDPEHMEQIIAKGMADGIILGRGIVADPELPNKARSGKADIIHKCIRCFVCNEGLYSTRNLRCSINPTAGRELQTKLLVPTKTSKKVLVAGGGPGGMTAAITAARCGHQVTLFEKSGELGGALKVDAHLPFKHDLIRFRDTLATELAKTDVIVKMNTPLTPKMAEAEKADILIAAMGAKPIIPKIPGIDNENVMVAEEIFTGGKPVGDNVVIVGGGLVGCEIGLQLAREGKKVTVIEMREEVVLDAAPDYRRFLMTELEKVVGCETNIRCVSINGEGVICADAEDSQKLFKADTVVVAAGYRALSDEAEALRDIAPEFRIIGDCFRARRVYEAVKDGYDAGMNI